MPRPEAFRKALQEALAARKVSQAEVARRLKRVESDVSRWVSGERLPPQPADVFALEEALGLAPGHLSSYLDFVPVGSSAPVAVDEAIRSDPYLDERGRAILMAVYQVLINQP